MRKVWVDGIEYRITGENTMRESDIGKLVCYDLQGKKGAEYYLTIYDDYKQKKQIKKLIYINGLNSKTQRVYRVEF